MVTITQLIHILVSRILSRTVYRPRIYVRTISFVYQNQQNLRNYILNTYSIGISPFS